MGQLARLIDSLKGELARYLEADYHVWNESIIKDRKRLFDQEYQISSPHSIEASKKYKTDFQLKNLNIPEVVKKLFLELEATKKAGVYPRLRNHQARALEAYLNDNKNLVIATGTGSGKTEAFLYPLIASIINDSKNISNRNGSIDSSMRSIILYPMNALINDQVTRLRKLCGTSESVKIFKKYFGRPLKFCVYTGKTEFAGVSDDELAKKKKKILKGKLQRNYIDITEENKKILDENHLYPALDIANLVKDKNLSQLHDDVEIYTRQEAI